MNIAWTSPEFAGMPLKAAVAPGGNKAAFSNDKSVGGVNGKLQGGYDALIEIKPDINIERIVLVPLIE